jgi:entericidin B
MEKNMNKIIITFTLIAIGFITVACNTMEGIGKDVKKGGENLEQSAHKNNR